MFGLSNVFAAGETSNTKPQTTASQTQLNKAIPAAETARVKVNVNTATLKDLLKIKGLNKAKSKNILGYRKKHGDFKSLDDLKLVKGFKKIKPEQLKQIEDQLSI